MSGGVAYVYDMENTFPKNVNKEMVELEDVDTEDVETLKTPYRTTFEIHQQ
jgi:glutamate synthase (NADPH/NADH) large chain